MTHLYLYGIIGRAEEDRLEIPGVDGTGPVHTVGYGELGCVVSEHANGDLRSLPKEELLRRLLRHQQVVEAVMQKFPVLPVRFGTWLTGAQEVRAFLGQGHAELVKRLEATRDRMELDVAATWDVDEVLKELATAPEVVQAREALQQKGTPSLEDRARLGAVVKACMDERRRHYKERIVTALKPYAIAVASHALVTDRLVANVAFWLEKPRYPEFMDSLYRLDASLSEEIAFRVVGPLPPYSFSQVEITALPYDNLEEARQVMQLDGELSEAAIRRAYRHQAADAQRLPGPGDGALSARLAALRGASEMLLRLYDAQRGLHSGSGSPTGAGEEAIPLFSIEVRGADHEEVEATRFGASAPLAIR